LLYRAGRPKIGVEDHAGRLPVDDTVVCLVRGPGSKYPRGFIWLIPVWFAILGGAAVLVGSDASSTGQMPLWLGVTEIGGLLIAACTAVGVLATVRHRAFRADQHGIWLGVRTERKRPKLRQVHLSWPDVAQLVLVPRRYGLLLEITLSPATRIVHRPSPGKQVILWLGALVMPFAFGRGTPALTMPTAAQPRYRVRICDRTAADLKLAIASVKPDTVPVRVATKKVTLRATAAPTGQQSLTRPPTPVA
jgi:hypothetical protein